jgi:hypothetical protein
MRESVDRMIVTDWVDLKIQPSNREMTFVFPQKSTCRLPADINKDRRCIIRTPLHEFRDSGTDIK